MTVDVKAPISTKTRYQIQWLVGKDEWRRPNEVKLEATGNSFRTPDEAKHQLKLFKNRTRNLWVADRPTRIVEIVTTTTVVG